MTRNNLLALSTSLGAPLCSTGLQASSVQTITVTGSPTGGTFPLSFLGAITAGLAFNATAATVQTALQGLSTIGSGNVTVTGSAGGPYTATFAGTLANTTVPLIASSGPSLTGGSSPSVTVTGAAAADTTVYTVPDLTTAVVKAGTVANLQDPTSALGRVPATFGLGIIRAGGSVRRIVPVTFKIDPGDSVSLTDLLAGQFLAAGDALVATPGAGNLDLDVSGVVLS